MTWAFSVANASIEDSGPSAAPHAVCWDDEVRTDPKSLTDLIFSAWMCVCGPALWLCARIKPMEQLCELSWVRALHVKLSPRQPPALTHPPSAPPPPLPPPLLPFALITPAAVTGDYRSWQSQIKGPILTYFQIFTLHPLLELGLCTVHQPAFAVFICRSEILEGYLIPVYIMNVDLFDFGCFFFNYYQLKTFWSS